MFFRRATPQKLNFDDRLQQLRAAGFTVEPGASGAVKVARGETALEIRETAGAVECTAPAGVVMGDEIGSLVDGGYQKFFRTPTGRSLPATADELKAIHTFEEDVKDALGLQSWYNQSLGTVSTYYLYDRVKDRDAGVPKRAWES
jgi:hypothetical protein